MVYRDTVIDSARARRGLRADLMRNTPGYVMAFDARTGKQKWAFHTVPKDGRAGRRHLGAELQRLYRQYRRVGADLGRSRARLRLSARGNADQRLLWRSSPGQQSVRQFGRLRRSRDRQAHLALPDHASRHLELRSLLRAGLGEHDGRRPAGESARAALQAGLRLCARSRDRSAHLADRGASGARKRRARRARVADAAASDQARRLTSTKATTRTI